jgi:hypothetical protein
MKPLTVDEAGSAAGLQGLRKRWYQLHALMGEMLDPADEDLAAFYARLGTTEEEFQQCYRASLERPEVALRRSPREIWVNGYLKNGGEAWAANMDVQFVLDPYAAANYVVAYMMKGNRSTSKLMEQAIIESKCGNLLIRDAMKYVGNRLLRAQEVCAQEAVFHLLGLDFVHCSRKVKYVDTRHPDERSVNLMDEKQMQSLEDDANVVLPSQLESYSNRPPATPSQDVCLADYTCWYEVSRSKAADDNEAADDEADWWGDAAAADADGEDDADSADEGAEADSDCDVPYWQQLPSRVGNRCKRRKAAILKHSHTKMKEDFEAYCRSRLMHAVQTLER